MGPSTQNLFPSLLKKDSYVPFSDLLEIWWWLVNIAVITARISFVFREVENPTLDSDGAGWTTSVIIHMRSSIGGLTTS